MGRKQPLASLALGLQTAFPETIIECQKYVISLFMISYVNSLTQCREMNLNREAECGKTVPSPQPTGVAGFQHCRKNLQNSSNS